MASFDREFAWASCCLAADQWTLQTRPEVQPHRWLTGGQAGTRDELMAIMMNK